MDDKITWKIGEPIKTKDDLFKGEKKIYLDRKPIYYDEVEFENGKIIFKKHKKFIDYLLSCNLEVTDDIRMIFISLPNVIDNSKPLSYSKGIYYDFEDKTIIIDRINTVTIEELDCIINILKQYKGEI